MQLVLDPMNNAASWSAFGPDGVTPSTQLIVADDTTHVRFGSDARSIHLSGSTAAFDHRLVRSLPNIDLSNLDELRLWVWSNRIATGATDLPFFLELRLASPAMSFADAGNTWVRYAPLLERGTWELLRLSVSDLPQAIRGAVNRVQLRCTNASTPFECYLDDFLAVRDEMITDVDAALVAALGGKLTLDGTPIPAVLYVAENPQAPALPHIRLTHYDIQLANERDIRGQTRTDYGLNSFQLRPISVAYDLYYEVDAFADTRLHQTRMLEFVLRSLAPMGQLVANGVGLSVEWVPVDPLDLTGKLRNDRPLLHFRVKARQEVGAATRATPPFNEINLNIDQQAAA
jgi:hypothetical protein